MEDRVKIFKDGDFHAELEINPPITFFNVPEKHYDNIYSSVKMDVLKWLVEKDEPETTISFLGTTNKYVFSRSVINVKTCKNAWLQYVVAICPDWDEIISFRKGIIIDEDNTDDVVCKNEIISESYGAEMIPLGYKPGTTGVSKRIVNLQNVAKVDSE